MGLGTGSQAAKIPPEKAFVDNFNASQDKILLITILVDNKFARDNLIAQVAAGNAPDIVGPMGTEGRGWFQGAWLDLQPLVDQFNYDTSDIDPAFPEFPQGPGRAGRLAVHIFPRRVLQRYCRRSRLSLPAYKLATSALTARMEELIPGGGKRLTVDANGNDATSPTRQGQRRPRLRLPVGQGQPAGSRPTRAVLPGERRQKLCSPTARSHIQWYYDAMWAQAVC
jgi:multiple sugar transport system substrate-binding protein